LGKKGYAGLFLLAFSTLMYEILLTRIFSVTMWYHFAFVAISVAMLGMSVGAILVFQFREYFDERQTTRHLALSSLIFGLTLVVSFLVHLSVPFVAHRSVVGLFSIAFNYSVVAVPFVFSGIGVCLALTRFPRQVSGLYAADLSGAALGCVAVLVMLHWMDGPSGVVLIAALACASAALFASESTHRVWVRAAAMLAVLLGIGAGFNATLARTQAAPLRLLWVKGVLQREAPLFERWNSFSRVAVEGDPSQASKPVGWGMSPSYALERQVRQLYLTIDASAATVITHWTGDTADLDFLKYDITNAVHYIRPQSRALVIGAGGGRDLLSAIVFGDRSAVGVEINNNVLEALNQKFGDFSGHLDRDSRLQFVNDEARSYIARSGEKYDIIQASLIDTWAATAAGAFVLSENSLYTTDAWSVLLDHLSPRGVITFSRWYFGNRPAEVYRLTALASAALQRHGVENPQAHIMLLGPLMAVQHQDLPNGVGTILVSREPFSAEDVDKIEQVARAMRFQVIVSPRFAMDPTFARIVSGKDLEEFTRNFPVNITPPTDDSPFFFHLVRLSQVLRSVSPNGDMLSVPSGWKAVFVLAALLVSMFLLTALCIGVPLALRPPREPLREIVPLLLFFAAIGFGFMLVEISQMQRLIVFLGHPTYGLSVVLFSLLSSSGLGSYATRQVPGTGAAGRWRLALLTGTLVLFGAITPTVIHLFQAATTPARIGIAVALLFPVGFLMGMAFPLGLKVASCRTTGLTPWLWGVNGATSVCASVLAVAIALTWGISASFWAGNACYATAWLAFVWATPRVLVRSQVASLGSLREPLPEPLAKA